MKKGYVAVMVLEETGEEPELIVTDLYEDAWQAIKYMQKCIDEGKYKSGRILELDIIPKERDKERDREEWRRLRALEEIDELNRAHATKPRKLNRIGVVF